MTRYTVTYGRVAFDALARLWLNASDRGAITQAGDEVERVLRDDAAFKGYQLASKLRQIIVAPLVVEFTVEESDRLVTIWSVRHIGELTNGS